jgi:hypothetical protein
MKQLVQLVFTQEAVDVLDALPPYVNPQRFAAYSLNLPVVNCRYTAAEMGKGEPCQKVLERSAVVMRDAQAVEWI